MKSFSKQLLFIILGIAILTAGGIGIYAVNNRGADPVLWLKFDEGYASTTYDASGNGNNGTLTGGVQWQNEPDCKQGKCLFLDGINDYVSVGNINKDIQTISFWIRPASTTDGVIELVDNTNYVSIINSAVSTTGFTSPTIYVNGIVNKTSLTLNQWNFIAMTTSSAVLASGVVIGEANNKYLTGSIDDVRLYDYARSASQIKADYLAAAGGRGASVILSSSEESRAASEGLVAYYKLDENAFSTTSANILDSSGGGNNLTAKDNAATSSTAKFGTAATFDGDGDYLCTDPDNDGDCDDDNDLDMGTSDFTIEAWVKTSATISDAAMVFSKRTGNIRYHLYLNSSAKPYAVFTDGVSGCTAYGNNFSALNDGSWHHIVFVVDRDSSSGGNIYVDNKKGDVICNPTALVNYNFNIASTFAIGRDGANSMYYFDGQIDDVKIYKTARTAEQIRRDYETGPPPVAHWKMDENQLSIINDSSGNGNTGSLHLGTTGSAQATSSAWTSGKFGSALDFDGSDDYVSVADNASLDLTTVFTLGAWVKPNVVSGSRAVVGKWNAAGSQRSYSLQIQDDEVWLRISAAGDTWSEYSGTTNANLQVGTWYHITGVYQNSSIQLYVNGVKRTISIYGVIPSSAYVGTADVKVGAWGAGDGSPMGVFNGLIDDVRIYNYARTQKQIMEDMNAGHPAVGSPVGSYVGYWPLDEGAGTTAYDKSTNANHLTISTTSAWTTAGKFGRAFANTAGKQYASRTDDPDFDFAATEDFSVSMWFKSNSATNPTEIEYLIRKADGSAGWAMYLATTTGQVGFATDDDTTWSPDDSAVSTDDFYDAAWHHAVGVKTGTTSLELFVDGVSHARDTSIAGNETLANSAALYIGDSTGSDSGDEFNGTIDEVKIYRIALSPEEVQQEYNRGVSLKLGAAGAAPSGGAGAGTSTDSALLEYCVPGGTDQCDPPVAHWKLDEMTGNTAYDTVGTNNGDLNLDGSPATSSAWQVTGCHAGSCLSFDGADDYVDVNDANSLDTGTIESITAWVKSNNAASVQGIVMHGYTDADGKNNSLVLTGGKIQFVVRGTGAEYEDRTGATTLQSNVWYHVAITYDGTTVRIYLNGVLDGSGSTTINLNSNSRVVIGRYQNPASSAWDYPFNGLIDDVRIYNYARTPAQIAWDFNRGKPVGWWKMDEGQDTATTCNATGASVYDYSGNANTGTLDLSGSPATSSAWSEGKYNCALDFDGTDDYVSVANASILQPSNITVSAWVQLNPALASQPQSFSMIIHKYNLTNKTGYGLFFDKGNDTCTLRLGNGSALKDISISSANTKFGTSWHHIVGTFDGTSRNIYLDGKLDKSTTESFTQSYGNETLYIGSYDGSVNEMDGIIDDVKIFNYALTETQIKNEYNQGAAVRFGPSEGLP